MTDTIDRCQILVKRTPQIITADNPGGRDFAHVQHCGRPLAVGEDMCPAHLRLRVRVGESRWQRILGWIQR